MSLCLNTLKSWFGRAFCALGSCLYGTETFVWFRTENFVWFVRSVFQLKNLAKHWINLTRPLGHTYSRMIAIRSSKRFQKKLDSSQAKGRTLDCSKNKLGRSDKYVKETIPYLCTQLVNWGTKKENVHVINPQQQLITTARIPARTLPLQKYRTVFPCLPNAVPGCLEKTPALSSDEPPKSVFENQSTGGSAGTWFETG